MSYRKKDRKLRNRWIPPQEEKAVVVQYPGCAQRDGMTKKEYETYGAKSFPTGTQIWIDGRRVL